MTNLSFEFDAGSLPCTITFTDWVGKFNSEVHGLRWVDSMARRGKIKPSQRTDENRVFLSGGIHPLSDDVVEQLQKLVSVHWNCLYHETIFFHDIDRDKPAIDADMMMDVYTQTMGLSDKPSGVFIVHFDEKSLHMHHMNYTSVRPSIEQLRD